MANQTISTNTNFDTLTGLLAGETVTVNNGAELLINSDPQVNRVMAGNVTINDGSVKIDGTTVRELSFSSASSLPVVGDTLTAGSVTGQVIGVTGTTASGRVRLRSLNGSISNGASLSFTGGKTATAASADGVGWLFVLFSESRTITLPRLGSMVVQGDWYYLGTSNGTANQTFTFYCNAAVGGLWVETGANTNQWIQYSNLRDLFPAQAGNGERGYFFGQNNQSSTIAFGDGVNGNIPPNGARIRTCNVMVASGLTSAPTTPTFSGVSSNWISTETSGGGTVSVAIANLCSVRLNCVNATNILLQDSTAYVLSASNIPDPLVASNVIFGVAGTSTAPVANIVLSSTSCNLTNVIASRRSVATVGSGGLLVSDSSELNFTNVKFYVFNRVTSDEPPFTATRCRNLFFNGCDFVGGRSSFTSCSGVEIKNYGHSDRNGTANTTSSLATSVFNFDNVLNVKIDGFRKLGQTSYFAMFRFASSSDNISIRNIGSSASPFDVENICSAVFSISSATTRIKLERIYLTNTRLQNPLQVQNIGSILSMSNIAVDADDGVETDVQNAYWRGVAGGNGVLGSTGVNIDQTAANGTHFGDFFFSAITGGLVILGNEKTSVSPSVSSYQITAGTPRFNGTGRVLLRSVGDRIEWTWPWFILGHTGFQNVAFSFSGTNQSNHLFQYQIDTGSGFGAWKTLNGANLSAETVSFTTGFRLKVAAECTVANSSNAIAAILIPTTTTATAQQTLYPIGETVNIEVNNMPVGATLAIYRLSDNFEIFKGFADSSGKISTTYVYEGFDIPVRIVCRLAGYIERDEEDFVIKSTGLTTPMRLVRDLTDNISD